MTTTPPFPLPPAGWYPDPLGIHDVRYWGGNSWSDHVADRSVESGPEPSAVAATSPSEGSSESTPLPSDSAAIGADRAAGAPVESVSSPSTKFGETRRATTPTSNTTLRQPAVSPQRLYSDAQARRDVERMVNKSRKGTRRISEVGRPSSGSGLACPNCGGAQFKARRSGAARVGIVGATVLTGGLAGPVVAAAVTKQTRVTCVTCGTVYLRG